MVQTLDPKTGGVARAVTLFSKGLAERGHEVEIVSLDRNKFPTESAQVKHHALGAARTRYGYSSALMPWLRQHGGGFDRVIVNGIWQYHSFCTWRLYAKSRIPYYVFPHGMLDPWFKRTHPFKHAKKWLYWPWAEYRVLRDAEAVIFTAEEEQAHARESFWLYQCRERIAPLGLETPRENSCAAENNFLEKFPALRGSRILLFMGRLHPKKGCDLLIEALARVADDSVVLVLAGPDQVGWSQTLRERVRDLTLCDRVVFTGMLEGAVKRGAFQAADAFVLPSHQENFGIAVVEALAAGLPVLISNRVNIWREIEADGAGYVENDDLAGTSRLIERWLRPSTAVRARMSNNAKQCFARRFELNRATESLLRILNESEAAP